MPRGLAHEGQVCAGKTAGQALESKCYCNKICMFSNLGQEGEAGRGDTEALRDRHVAGVQVAMHGGLLPLCPQTCSAGFCPPRVMLHKRPLSGKALASARHWPRRRGAHAGCGAQAMRLSRELAAVQAGADARAEAAGERVAALQAAVERLSAEAGAAGELAAAREQARPLAEAAVCAVGSARNLSACACHPETWHRAKEPQPRVRAWAGSRALDMRAEPRGLLLSSPGIPLKDAPRSFCGCVFIG